MLDMQRSEAPSGKGMSGRKLTENDAAPATAKIATPATRQ
jgi:hypothetical protein